MPELVTELRAMVTENADEFRRVALEKMREGDAAFWRLLLERVWPVKLEVSGNVETAPRSGEFVPSADEQAELEALLRGGGIVH